MQLDHDSDVTHNMSCSWKAIATIMDSTNEIKMEIFLLLYFAICQSWIVTGNIPNWPFSSWSWLVISDRSGPKGGPSSHQEGPPFSFFFVGGQRQCQDFERFLYSNPSLGNKHFETGQIPRGAQVFTKSDHLFLFLCRWPMVTNVPCFCTVTPALVINIS